MSSEVRDFKLLPPSDWDLITDIVFTEPDNPNEATNLADARCYIGDVEPRRLMPDDAESPEGMERIRKLAGFYEALRDEHPHDQCFRFSDGEWTYRATRTRTHANDRRLTLRRIPQVTPRLENIRLPTYVPELLMDQDLLGGGLVIVTAPVGQGKSTTLAGTISSRLHAYSGQCTTIEDPCEQYLHGWHGNGECVQTELPSTDQLNGREIMSKAINAELEHFSAWLFAKVGDMIAAGMPFEAGQIQELCREYAKSPFATDSAKFHETFASVLDPRDTHARFAGAVRDSLRNFAVFPGGGAMCFPSEIRDAETAAEICRAAQAGYLVLTTLHAPNPMSTVFRLVSLAAQVLGEVAARDIIASCLRLVVYQQLTLVPKRGATPWDRGSLSADILYNEGPTSKVAQMIREGSLAALAEPISTQNDILETSRSAQLPFPEVLKRLKGVGGHDNR